MKILLTNDDGIGSKGIRILAEKLSEKHDVSVVAPLFQKSACSHAITIYQPLKAKKIDAEGKYRMWGVDGTPADCMKLAYYRLLDGKPDLVISGINQGPNLGTDVIYSGTVAGAVEASIMGIRGMAVSLNSHVADNFSYSAEIASIWAERIADMKEKTVLNINVPNVEKERIKGTVFTRLGSRQYANVYEHAPDARGYDYYWLKGEPLKINSDNLEIDVAAVQENYVSVTPLFYDFTDYEEIACLRKNLENNASG